MGTNIGEVLTVFLAMLFWKVTPLLAVHLCGLILSPTSSAIALGMEQVEGDVMTRRPKPKNEGIFAGGLGLQVVLQGVMFAVLTLIGFMIGWKNAGSFTAARTMAFTILALTQLVQAFNMRSVHSLFRIGAFSNKTLCLAAGISLVLIGIILFIPPVTSVFSLTQLTAGMYLSAVLLAFVPLPVMECAKKFGLIRQR